MFSTFWYSFLYQPVFNTLIWIYNHWTHENLGWAVVYLTIIIRVLLLPFTYLEEKAKKKNEELVKDVQHLQKSYKNDPVVMKEEIRRMLQRRKVKPWAKAVVIGMQLLTLILLYQVFLQGITGERVLHTLYSFVEVPGTIRTDFLGFDIGLRHNYLWSGMVGLWLFVEIYAGFRHRTVPLTKGDVAFLLLFPFSVAFFLWILPMVKCIFILTSFIFSLVVSKMLQPFLRDKKASEGHH